MKQRPLLAAFSATALLSASLAAQTYDELNTVRSRPSPYSSVLQFKAGMLGDFAKKDDPATGLRDTTGWDGSVYYRNDTFFGRPGTTEAYAGRDGAYLAVHDHTLAGNETSSVLELKTRYFPFYREGFYDGSDFVPTGRYEGSDWEAYLGFSRPLETDTRVELGPYYRHDRFSRNADTAGTYAIPDGFNSYGIRLFVEQSTLQLDRDRGIPNQGFLLTVVGEKEWNNSSGAFGEVGLFETELPSSVWRARGRLEWYVPQSDNSVWEVFATGALTDEKDRVVNYDAQHPQGNAWVDAQLRYRIGLGDSATITPFVAGQFVRILDEDGGSSDKKFFFGYGAELWLHFNDAISMNAWYSFLDNESRPSVSVSDDRHGQHMFYVGLVARFGAQRR